MTPGDFEAVTRVLSTGGSAAVAVGLAWVCWQLWRALAEERAARLADKDRAAERMLAMAEQDSKLAIDANASTIANTAAIEAMRSSVQEIKAGQDRLERRAGQ